MARTAKEGFSRHATKGYRISIGRKQGGGYRTFWLGHERAVAEYAAHMYRERFTLMRAQVREEWTPADEAVVREFVDLYKYAVVKIRNQHQLDVQGIERKGRLFDQVFGGNDAAPVQTAEPGAKPTQKLYAAIDAYVEAFKAKTVSPAHKERTQQLLDDLKHFRPDVDLVEIDRVWLQTLTDHIRARPKARKRKTNLAPYTVRNMLRA